MRSILALALAFMLLGCIGGPGTGNTENNRQGGNGTTYPGTTGAGNTQPGTQDGIQDSVSGTQGSGNAENGASGSNESNGETQNTEPETSDAESSGQASGKTDVLVLGRSVAYGWSEYMGLEWQEDESYVGEYEGKTFRYLHMDYPPDIDDSAIRAMETYDYDVVFFKLCFVDFGTEYGDMLADDKQYIQNVYQEAVVNRHKQLVVGNALPQVSRDTTSGLKQNHQDFNSWLDTFASTHDGVYVLDLHGLLVDGSGNLKSEYATSYEDSHPNTAGYNRITPAFMDTIDQAMGD